ncbi:MBL fold metallo-hydrolase [Persicobacter psychrovividus]|uniref:MBL fold metallo-hydrolase n=1 Tax=Persicobacter psychrovividus TaxID=387638 RepID=A0ABM7VFJ4_9BACT|nr:MBL fold metallo-hydrolase [Persicobacter psychrovividus]
MKLHVIDAGDFKLDGGAMFGVVPKNLWGRYVEADERNLVPLKMRCLLIEDGDRKILIDTGLGNKQAESFFKHYHLFGDGTLLGSLEKVGVSPEDITDVFITHFHLDHAGGAIVHHGPDNTPAYQFPNAKYWTNRRHWEWATKPNPREAASFLKENILPIESLGQMHFVEDGADFPFEIIFSDGHTEGQMCPKIRIGDQTLIFMADFLMPTVAHIPLAWVVGYDTRPLLTFDEKKAFLQEAADQQYLLFMEHDIKVEVCTVKHTEKGVRLDKSMTLAEALADCASVVTA